MNENIPGWKQEDNTLVKEFVFKDFAEAFGFMASVATAAEKLGHHPDWSNSYNRVTIRLTTHSKGGLSDLDFQLAKRCDELSKKLVV